MPVLPPAVLATADLANEPVEGYAQKTAPARLHTPSPACAALTQASDTQHL